VLRKISMKHNATAAAASCVVQPFPPLLSLNMLLPIQLLVASYRFRLVAARFATCSLLLGSFTIASAATNLTTTAPRSAPPVWPADAFLPLTEQRISTLPAAEQEAWAAYWRASRERAKLAPLREATEPTLSIGQTSRSTGASRSRGLRLRAPAEWYATPEAHTIADHVAKWQSAAGGWSKSGDYLRDPQPSDNRSSIWSAGTFDNDATTGELRFLALVISANRDAGRGKAWRDSFQRGLEYILAAQYPNGGFPQIYPLVGGYHDAITFNDDALAHVLQLLDDVGAQRAPYAFVSDEQATIARKRVEKGVACILAAQIKNSAGQRTVWCQQHDPLTLKPCAARNFEPIAYSTGESAGLVEFLFTLPQPTPEIIAAVDGAVDWLALHAIPGVEWDRTATQGTGLVEQNGKKIWARFYEIDTGQPIFGDRDRSIHYTVTEISEERRRGYAWYITRPSALPPAYLAWKKKLAKS
jgi:PelA/Pel-15E family pectate lyase